jgi:TPR repeat protein
MGLLKNIIKNLTTNPLETELDATIKVSEQLENKTAESVEAKTLYNTGLTFDGKDNKKAFEYFVKASDKGSSEAYYMMGEMYRLGEGVSQDYDKALQCFLIAAENYDVDANVNLGVMYLNGIGVPKDPDIAFKHYSLAARLGDHSAMKMCGFLLGNGTGVQQNFQMSYAMFKLAIEFGDEYSSRELHPIERVAERINFLERTSAEDFVKEMKKIINQNIHIIDSLRNQTENALENQKQNVNIEVKSDENETIAFQEEFSTTKRLAEQGNHMAQNNLGSFYYNGTHGVKQDAAEALHWYEKAAASNLPIANYNLGCMYANGIGVDHDYEKAVELFQKAADRDHAESSFMIGSMYIGGYGVKQDYHKGLTYLIKAGEAGVSQAFVLLGDIGRNGELPEMGRNTEYAASMYSQAAMLGNDEALYNLGCAYATGEGVERSFILAHACFTLAVKYGNKDAVSKGTSTAEILSIEQKKEAMQIVVEMQVKIDNNIRQLEKNRVVNEVTNQSEQAEINHLKNDQSSKDKIDYESTKSQEVHLTQQSILSASKMVSGNKVTKSRIIDF